MFRECLSGTTAHGISHLVDENENRCSKWAWAFIVLVSMAIFCFHSSSLIDKFVNHSIAISVNFDGTPFIIPDIYICNNNPFSKALIDKNFKYHNEQFINMSLAIQNDLNTIDSFRESIFYNRQILGYSKEFTMNVLSNRNFTDFSMFIRLGNRVYKAAEVFDQVPNSYHNYCYKLKDHHKKFIYQKHALTFTMYTDEFNFTKWPLRVDYALEAEKKLMNEHSHVVYFVNPGEYPHREAARVEIERGEKTTIDVKMDYFDKLNRKRKPCELKEKLIDYIIDWLNTSSTKMAYRTNAYDCALEKFHEKYLQECNCSWAMYPLNWNLWQIKNIKPCWIHQMGQFRDLDQNLFCTVPERQMVEDYYQDCSHKNLCHMPEFYTQLTKIPLTVTSLKRVATFYANPKNYVIKPSIYETLQAWLKGTDSSSAQETVRQSFAQISIYAPKRVSKVWKEYVTFEMKDLLSDIGGILGFYVGVSVVTILEIFGYLARRISPLIFRTRNKQEDIVLPDTNSRL